MQNKTEGFKIEGTTLVKVNNDGIQDGHFTCPKGLTKIGNFAFANCTNLTSITLSRGLTEIGQHAFSGCANLTSITLPRGTAKIGHGAFSGCANLTSITLSRELTEIGHGAFSGCTNLTSITLPRGVAKIGQHAFHGCINLTSITLPRGVAEIGHYAFSGCTNLTTIIDFRFKGLNQEQLDSIIRTLPPGVESIILDDKTITMNDYHAEHLLVDVAHLTAKQGMARIAFDEIKPAREINERRLNQMINFLEKQNNPIADLTCGLLLEGRIETTADILENCQEFDNYMEKRTHDAISFYTKSASDPAIKPIAEFLLWEIKTTSAMESVKNRLAQYDVTPNAVITTINSFNEKSRQGIITPLLASFGVFGLPLPQQNDVKATATFKL